MHAIRATLLSLFVCLTAFAQPLVDHHQHLLSPSAAALVNKVLPAIELPAPIAKVVADRVARWNDPKGLAELYAADVIVLGPEGPGWVSGREAAASLMGTVFARPFLLTPVAYRGNTTAANVSGYITRNGRPLGYFLLDLHKRSDGNWEIAAEVPKFPGPKQEPVITAENLIAMLDEAGIRRAVVLSNAYYFDFEDTAAVRAENDWTAEQIKPYPGRLVAFCSVNPLAPYAVEEIDRCAKSGSFKGLKLHFNQSKVNLLDASHVQKVRKAVEAANRNRFALIIHVRADGSYGRDHARVLLRDILPAAPDVVTQIAHLWGGEALSEPALVAYADAVAANEPATRNLYFDVAQTWFGGEQDLQKIVAQMRRIGVGRILYASDGPEFNGVPPAEAWKAFRAKMPLTAAELTSITGNVAPYLRGDSLN
jgi:predicted TIM-barrel fold metal-dependent hydrolase